MIPASKVFALLESQETPVIDRFEFAFEPFGTLRRDLRLLILGIQDSESIDEALSISLRSLLCEWLTTPIDFLEVHLRLTAALGTQVVVRERWPVELKRLYDAVARSSEALQALQNPMRESLRKAVDNLNASGVSFRILCHRRARPTYESLAQPAKSLLETGGFLHSAADYRNCAPFDVLVKVGPLRARGWGSAPDAVISAPRFRTLMQFVWNGCNDEAGFGYDPACPAVDSSSPDAATSGAGRTASFRPISWTKHVRQIGSDGVLQSLAPAAVDELHLFSAAEERRETRPAVLVELDAGRGLLCPPNCEVLSFDPDPQAHDPIDHRVPCETLVQGIYVIIPDLYEVDLGSVRAQLGQHSRTWRSRLVELSNTDRAGLVARLFVEGLDLYGLSAALDNWSRPPDTVIHAPRRLNHFRILLRVLGLEDRYETTPSQKRVPFWQLAWHEIQRSRGEAIQAGFQEHEIVDEELRGILASMLPGIRSQAVAQSAFELKTPPSNDIKGKFRFFRISAIEDGFAAPDSELRIVRPSEEFELWRD